MVEEADVQDTTKLFEVISVTDSEVASSGAGWVVSPSDVSTWEIKGNNNPISIASDFRDWENVSAEVYSQEPCVVVKSKRVTSRRP